jgi:hypothetical protein
VPLLYLCSTISIRSRHGKLPAVSLRSRKRQAGSALELEEGPQSRRSAARAGILRRHSRPKVEVEELWWLDEFIYILYSASTNVICLSSLVGSHSDLVSLPPLVRHNISSRLCCLVVVEVTRYVYLSHSNLCDLHCYLDYKLLFEVC